MEDVMERTILSESSIEKIKCSSCQKYLSFPPIYWLRGRYTCGRCPSQGYRNHAYEELGKFISFPCSNKNCTMNFAWDAMKNHEEECLYRKIICPIIDCKSQYELADAEKHFDDYHKEFKRLNEFKLSGIIPTDDLKNYERNSDLVFLFIHNGKIYMVFISLIRTIRERILQYRHKIAVYSGQNENSRYKATLTFIRDKPVTVIVDAQTYLFHKKRDDVRCETVANLGTIDGSCATTEVTLQLEIYETTQVSKDSNGQQFSQEATVSQKCSVCDRRLSVGPVYFSEDGYRCGRCPANGHRDVAYEELGQYVRFRCSHDKCDVIFPWESKHEEECLHRKISCPFPDCKNRYEAKEIEGHFDVLHKAFKHVNELKLSNRTLAISEEVFLLTANDAPYIVQMRNTNKEYKKMGDVVEYKSGFRVYSMKIKPSNRYKITLD